jgi:hypothetical protein
MKTLVCGGLILVVTSWSAPQSPQSNQGTGHPAPSAAAAPARTADVLEANVKAEWEAFKNKDKKAYSDLLTEDFIAVEDDGQGMRKKSAAVGEVDQSVVSKYYLVALKVLPLGADAALVTYELTIEFPPKAQIRIKRVLVSELWLKRDGKWKLRYYQETRAR